MENFSKLSAAEKKTIVNRITADCHSLATKYIKDWKPVDPSWPTEDGCAYLRLSSVEQVLVEKGSLEQQIWITVSEVEIRSKQDKINYRIIKFYIEPGISGRHDRRPQFLLMILDIEKNKYRFVAVKELSRFARHLGIIKKFSTTCHRMDCQIIIRGFPLNLNDPTQLLQLDLLAAFGEYESNVNSKRVRESCFSAMVSSGKFNSTHPVLGLDQLVEHGKPKVGFYIANEKELETVRWIMTTFVRLGSFTKTLEECNKLGVTNKNNKPFKTNSLYTLLTNRKYIGEWEVNAKRTNSRTRTSFYLTNSIELQNLTMVQLSAWTCGKKFRPRSQGSRAQSKNALE